MDEKAKLAWVMFYCAVKGWQYHPGAKERLSTHECAQVADNMLDEYMTREEAGWAGWQQRR